MFKKTVFANSVQINSPSQSVYHNKMHQVLRITRFYVIYRYLW